jgi:membrane protease YdiL (CAAX protease family)
MDPSAPTLAAMAAPQAVIFGTFAFAATVFFISWALRGVGGKAGRGGEAGPPPREAPPPDAAGRESVPTIPDPGSPYAPPGTMPPPLPGDAEPEAAGPFKVSTRHYRLLDLPLIGLVFLLYAGLTASAGPQDDVPVAEKLNAPVLVASIFMQFIFMALVIGFVSWRVRLAEWLGLRWRKWPLAFAIAPAALVFMWVLMGILHATGWNQWLEDSLGIESMQDAVKLLQEAKDPLVLVLMAVAAVFVAPVAEEVIFRGYLYPAAKRFCGPSGAMVFSSLVFAAAHGNVVAIAPLFLLALLLCLVYEFTGSIWSCIAIHFLFNAATVTIQLLVRAGVFSMPAGS